MKRITGLDVDGCRYRYDFGPCTPNKGWAQLDTSQDASWYGNWVNPTKLKLLSYCEGDVTLIECDSEEEFKEQLAATLKWHVENDYQPKIDGMCSEEIIAAFTRLGFAEWLH